MKCFQFPKAVMAFAFVTLLLVATGASLSVSDGIANQKNTEGYHFESYVRDFSKQYGSVEAARLRNDIFTRNLAQIQEHNRGKHSYTMGVNGMTDWTDAEFQRLNGARPHMRHSQVSFHEYAHRMSNRSLPFQVDHRNAVPSVLTAVKNQGGCGSCWAHSAVEALESHVAIATGRLHVLSQQQLTSCTPNPRHCGGTGGCFGSVEALAFEYLSGTKGIVEEWAYPYTSFYGDSGICFAEKGVPVARVSGYVAVPDNDQTALMDAVAHVGPIAVSVAASGWRNYRGGIFDGCDYAQNITQNHAVQLVGYGHDDQSGKDYWIIRNSWGPLWGEHGYMRLLRESEPTCGWSTPAHDGAACDGDPDEVWVCGMCGILSGATYPIVRTD